MPVLHGAVVLCDANVLYKSLVRDLIVRLGIQGVIRPRWTNEIHEEWIGNLLAHRPDLSRVRLERTRDMMNRAVPESLVTAQARSDHTLPDPDDQHVLNAALASGASVLLTFNLADFPSRALPPHLQAVHPDPFLQGCLEGQTASVLEALQELRAALSRPPITTQELLDGLKRAEVPSFAEKLQVWAEKI
ncbi:PIN domain-containing protein [Deinococcus aestuarii]|uniref:PIN domain-containing protein n=1 Tax=Deinococcus aestuarii TaxID=2774531 RepID=UPI002484AD45|nr:PIN domain-containing protein [Deinococcus aestuarii]